MSKTIFNTFTEFDDIMVLFCFKYSFNLKKNYNNREIYWSYFILLTVCRNRNISCIIYKYAHSEISI